MGDLDAPASRVRAVLEGVFRPVTAIGDGFVAQRRSGLAAGAALTPDRLSGMREIIWRQLRLLPAADGAGFVAAPGVIAGKDRHLEWWQRTANGDGDMVEQLRGRAGDGRPGRAGRLWRQP